MKRITIVKDAFFVERPGLVWAQVVAGVLLAPWLLAMLWALFTTSDSAALVAFLWTLLTFIPAVALRIIWGSTRRYRIAAVVEARDVPGGAFMVVVDVLGARHEVVTTPGIARGVSYELAGVASVAS